LAWVVSPLSDQEVTVRDRTSNSEHSQETKTL
jgi:hypothetical protein